MSTVADPYQPIERKLNLTRGLLEIMETCQPKLVVQTRSPDVVRDIDLFQSVAKLGGRVQVNITVTTDDEDIRRTFEPICPSNERRLQAARELHDSDVDTCITMTPLLLVKDAEAFAGALRQTGIKKFIFQPFHFQRGKFVAGTRAAAQNLMIQKLNCKPEEFRRHYLEHYHRARSVFKKRLPDPGEGKEGFAPQF